MTRRKTNNTPPKEDDTYWLTPADNARRHHESRRLSHAEWQRRALMKDFFGDRSPMEISARLAPSESLGTIRPDVVGKLQKTRIPLLEQLVEQWSVLVGEGIAEVASPGFIKMKVLYIEVSHSAWLYVLEREQKSTILALVQKIFGKDKIKDLRFIAKGRR